MPRSKQQHTKKTMAARRSQHPTSRCRRLRGMHPCRTTTTATRPRPRGPARASCQRMGRTTSTHTHTTSTSRRRRPRPSRTTSTSQRRRRMRRRTRRAAGRRAAAASGFRRRQRAWATRSRADASASRRRRNSPAAGRRVSAGCSQGSRHCGSCRLSKTWRGSSCRMLRGIRVRQARMPPERICCSRQSCRSISLGSWTSGLSSSGSGIIASTRGWWQCCCSRACVSSPSCTPCACSPTSRTWLPSSTTEDDGSG
mmetsp:Transcript_52015/g.106004  ORF Transcript_52015/g.106004 Transcript_52015/m.106004 type:complete len:255 (+) Transcript_52015:312-1076(+)